MSGFRLELMYICHIENIRSSLIHLHDSQLPVCPSRTNFKLHNISVTRKMFGKVVMNLDLSKASGSNCIPVVVLKNCEPELSHILVELFNKCLKESSQLL